MITLDTLPNLKPAAHSTRALKWAGAALALLFGAVNLVQAQGVRFDRIKILTEELAPGVYLLTGSAGDDPIHEDAAGGRIALLVGNEGVLMVDSQYAPLTPDVLAAVRKISNQPIRVLVNTHVHLDHIGGNAAITSTGALVFAREEAREAMFLPLPAIAGTTAPPNDSKRFPLVTYGPNAEIKLRMDGETIDLIAVPPAHTAGDTLVRFEQADAFMVGDFYRSYGYPFWDSARGGTLRGTLDALGELIRLSDPAARIVPGHGRDPA